MNDKIVKYRAKDHSCGRELIIFIKGKPTRSRYLNIRSEFWRGSDGYRYHTLTFDMAWAHDGTEIKVI